MKQFFLIAMIWFVSGCAPQYLVVQGKDALRYNDVIYSGKATAIGQRAYVGGQILAVYNAGTGTRVELANRMLNHQGYPDAGTENRQQRIIVMIRQGFDLYENRPGDRLAAIGQIVDIVPSGSADDPWPLLIIDAENYRAWPQSVYQAYARFGNNYFFPRSYGGFWHEPYDPSR